jgi:DNA-binding NarL/FixJ family response regulator
MPEGRIAAVLAPGSIWSTGIVPLLTSLPFEVIVLLNDLERAVAYVKEVAPDVILLVRLVGADEISAVRRLAEAAPTVRIVVLSDEDVASEAAAAMRAGAYAYVTPFNWAANVT